jgi:outer membrane protein
MKNGLLIWNIVLTVIAGYLLISHFTSKKSTAPVEIKSAKDSNTQNTTVRIAYFEMDSIAVGLNMVKDLRTEMDKMESKNTRELEDLRKNLQQKFNYFQTQIQSGTLSQAQLEAANIEMKNLDEGIRNRKMQLDADYNEFVTMNQNDIKTKIEDFLKEYNKDKYYSYIFANEKGLFYYCDTVYNITDDVIKGLNEKHKPKK